MRFMTSLRFIDVVAREGSIRKAADKLGQVTNLSGLGLGLG